MNKTVLGVVIAVIAVVGAVMLLNRDEAPDVTENNNQNQTENPNPNPSPSPSTNESSSQNPSANPTPTPSSVQPKTYAVSMTDSGYSPSSLTIKKGDTVVFTNNGTKGIWPASAPHPTHTDYPAFDPKKNIAVGASWSFTFDRLGTWRYHDHSNPTRSGLITVTE